MSKRIKFFLSHLAISVCIALIIIGIVFFIWYVSPLAQAVGVTHIFLMMLMVDVIIGPLLGLLVYKEGKKSLKFDLTAIIAIQLAALLYGFYTISQGRPVWIVYSVDRFEVVRANEVYTQHLDQALPQFQHVSLLSPRFAAIKFAQDSKQRNKEMFEELFEGIAVSQRPERYVELSLMKSQIQSKLQPLTELEKYNHQTAVQLVLAKYPHVDAWLPLSATAQDMVVLMNREKAEVVKIVDLRPWN
ncbi:TfpX/TfpZ family type IV pilin accessory protein [Acinetobacter junii]|uniref:TfpX/TfpZ family type IV pilin accessory protein n=1 Tax=Acinetobacter junii TaxID=40215 RepID=UPI003A8A225F